MRLLVSDCEGIVRNVGCNFNFELQSPHRIRRWEEAVIRAAFPLKAPNDKLVLASRVPLLKCQQPISASLNWRSI